MISKQEVQQVAQTIRQQIYAGGSKKVVCWAPRAWFMGTDEETEMVYLRFRVSGALFSGLVKVLYNRGKDLYEVRLIKGKSKLHKEVKDVYADELTNTIDGLVEYPGDKESYRAALHALDN